MFLWQIICLNYPDKTIIVYLDINSIRDKFEILSSLVEKNINFLMISKTIEHSFCLDF